MKNKKILGQIVVYQGEDAKVVATSGTIREGTKTVDLRIVKSKKQVNGVNIEEISEKVI